MSNQTTTAQGLEEQVQNGAQERNAEEMSLGTKIYRTISSSVAIGAGAALLGFLATQDEGRFNAAAPGAVAVLLILAGMAGLVHTNSSYCRGMRIFNEGRQPSTPTNDPNSNSNSNSNPNPNPNPSPTTRLLGPGSSSQ